MIIGRMDKRITLLEPIREPDGRGGYTSTPTTKTTVWAEFRKPNLQTAVASGAVVSEMSREISIRYREDICKGWKVQHGQKVFDVLHTYDYDKSTTVLVCREVVK